MLKRVAYNNNEENRGRKDELSKKEKRRRRITSVPPHLVFVPTWIGRVSPPLR